MVDWNLFMGTIPPLNYQEWIEAFDQYKQYPEFQERNYMFTLADFKKIFFWEYLQDAWKVYCLLLLYHISTLSYENVLVLNFSYNAQYYFYGISSGIFWLVDG